MLRCFDRLQDVEIVEDGAKHTLVLYNCKVPLTGELWFTAANAKCSANMKVKGERSLPSTENLKRDSKQSTELILPASLFISKYSCGFYFNKM